MEPKKYIFGYGSLVSAEDIARTLGRKPSLIHPVELDGWVREWGVVINNSDAVDRCVRLSDGSVAPGYIVVLNVRRPASGEKPTNPNGVLFEVTDADLMKMDDRETHYRRLDVTTDVINRPPGVIYTYTGLDKFLITNHNGAPKVIPGSYHELVSRGFASLGSESHKKYLASTRRLGLRVRAA